MIMVIANLNNQNTTWYSITVKKKQNVDKNIMLINIQREKVLFIKIY